MSMLESMQKFMEPIKRRVMMMIGLGVIEKTNDAGNMQSAKISLLKDEVRDGIERFQNYGFTSVPKTEAEALVACIGGNRDHAIIICVDDRRYRIKSLQDGEVCIYTDEGDKIHLKRGNKIEISTKELLINAEDKVDINTENFNLIATTKASFTSQQIEMQITSQLLLQLLTNFIQILPTGINISGLNITQLATVLCNLTANQLNLTGNLSATSASSVITSNDNGLIFNSKQIDFNKVP